jgi:hypothetical protein
MYITHKKLISGLCLITCSTLSAPIAFAGDREIGGYVDREKSRFVRVEINH